MDNGASPGAGWNTAAFSDTAWPSGNAELGYGDGDEATVVSYGPSSSGKYITTYFRKTFNVTDPSLFFSLDLQAVRDDGIVVYINGTEVWRNNMPSGTITNSTLASSAIAFAAESSWNAVTLGSGYLVTGINLIAVEIHQDAANSSDISFNLKLGGNTSAPAVTADRGPYLNLGTPNSMTVKWRTAQAADSKVFYGTDPSSLNQVAFDPAFGTNHEVKITGLDPATIYYYMIGYTGGTLTAASSDIYFKTSPPESAAGDYTFWAIGDAGTGDDNQRRATAGMMRYINGGHIDGWIWLGDNSYDNGYDSQYQNNVFTNNTYEKELKRFVVWPAPGNHDYNNHIPLSPAPAYYDIFTLPAHAEAGGLASGTEKYYSYNYGNIHFIVLDSYDEGRNTTDPMAIWLTNDLAANTQPWTIAYWHHPPYTKGTHDSDNGTFLDGELVDIRENILPIIEAGGVDLVLNGHSHTYERSYLMDGHYGYSGTLSPAMITDHGSGSYPAACPYQKETTVTKAHKGTVYAVCGCSGKVGSTSSGWPHPVMYKYSNTTFGSMLLEVKNNRLDAKFIDSTGAVADAFTIVKNAGTATTISSCPGENISLKPSWPATVEWFPSGITADSIIVNPLVSTVYYAYDALSCIRDTFNISMLPAPGCTATGIDEQDTNGGISVFPAICAAGTDITVRAAAGCRINAVTVYDVVGKNYHTTTTANSNDTEIRLTTEGLPAGVCFVGITTGDGRRLVKKIIITH